ncbi:glycerol-3-phosphate dehydrogenase/oxidase [Paenibacillus sp. UNC499MF]|uniref:glycerol-3-phosphate dehydrogenase/oxidase n=1 Tax=Paenibacillus sp. UNC499MF TaxID=1502751 RepID=UPI00089FF983|nr:glycerol-3-phosphate dehydrogenase [Paenibacillus sp. UNC499MF]
MDTAFSGDTRKESLWRMEDRIFDVLVIGGGITGAGIALDAQSRGLKTALVDMQDFAQGTSSRSTKLVHGGLRYLKQLEVKVVAEVGKERAIVYENGPHVTTPEWMLLPFYQGGTFGAFSTSIGLRVYDFLAGVKKSERRSMLSPQETLDKEPLLKEKHLKGGGYYVEYRTDDARLTIEVMKKAVEFGVQAVSYAKVEAFEYENGRVTGVRVADQLSGETHLIRAKRIVNAAGPWVDTLRERDGSKKGKTLRLTKGVHLVFDGERFPLRQAIYFDTPDGRMLFAIPRDGKTYIGTTDTNYKEDIAHPVMTTEDRTYIIRAANEMFPTLRLTEQDVESSWAGLRPLIHQEGKDPSEISRKDEIFVSDSGLISIAGGKLTGYRKMAETVVDLVVRQLQEAGGVQVSECQTRTLPISGGDVGGSARYPQFVEQKVADGQKLGLTVMEARLLAQRYGSNIDKVYRLIDTKREEAEAFRIPASLFGTLVYSIEQEMTVKPSDFFVRRTGAVFFNIKWVRTWKEPVIHYMASRFNWTEEQRAAYTAELERDLHDAVVPIDEKTPELVR